MNRQIDLTVDMLSDIQDALRDAGFTDRDVARMPHEMRAIREYLTGAATLTPATHQINPFLEPPITDKLVITHHNGEVATLTRQGNQLFLNGRHIRLAHPKAEGCRTVGDMLLKYQQLDTPSWAVLQYLDKHRYLIPDEWLGDASHWVWVYFLGTSGHWKEHEGEGCICLHHEDERRGYTTFAELNPEDPLDGDGIDYVLVLED